MMRSKVYSLVFFILVSFYAQAQYTISGVITNDADAPLPEIEIYLKGGNQVTKTDAKGNYVFENVREGSYVLSVFGLSYELIEETIKINADVQKSYRLLPLGESLSEVVLSTRKERIFALRSLKKVEGTAIYAGKKSEVVLIDQITGNLAANAPRQIYSQVVGLNIYENGDAGLQLNIGGRGLDPNRSANFNIRQNGYDISADVLGYPESYYTPPAEALREIQVVRGAASLQYGTQFGGLINFKFKKPNPDKKIELISRQTAGSFGLLTSFNSLSGTLGKFSYYTYFNYKRGDGFRPNSQFNSRNYFAHLGYKINENTTITGELTLFNYLAKQAGGLTDVQFLEDPDFSNRDRNWFDIDWKVYSLRLDHKFSKKTDFSLNLFGLNARRSAVGFRENRVSQTDDLEAPREVLIDNFSNWGAEARLLTHYDIGKRDAVLLVGSKYYNANNDQRQGPGTIAADADFSFTNDEFPNFGRQAQFEFPNRNLAVFGENIFNITDRLSITPGFRFEYIKTESDGFRTDVALDLAGNLLSSEDIPDNRNFERDFVLLGTGITYRLSPTVELYGNISQNYRSVTFNDINTINPSSVVDPNITDEEGFTIDIGARGRLDNKLSYDVSVFGVSYSERLGEILIDGSNFRPVRFRSNIGDAFIYGLEFFGDWNLRNTFFEEKEHIKLNFFTNLALTDSEYISSEKIGVEGNQVEFIPDVNLKTGVNFGYKNLTASIQYTYLTEQFTDATNAPQDVNDNQRGIEGTIPSYGILDISAAYTYKRWRLETGLNNALDESYFTRRATGYPGPGIIPAEPLAFYTTLQVKF